MTPTLSLSMSGFPGLDRVVPRLIAEDGFKDREAALRGIAGPSAILTISTEGSSRGIGPGSGPCRICPGPSCWDSP